MEKIEKRATFSLASIFAFRMLGLFMILPVFSLYAKHLVGTTPTLIGLAIGIYGLTQALLQIPFGMVSDRIGRKPVIAFGLVIFGIGSVIAATAQHIDMVIFGRALQGAGAIGSTVSALLADLTQEQNRTKAMAVIGLTVGVAFTVSMILGPILNAWISVPGIFALTAILAMFGIVILFSWVPTPSKIRFQRESAPVLVIFKEMLRHPELMRLNFGIMVLHILLTASFVVIPISLVEHSGLGAAHQWYLYLPVLLLAFVAMLPMMIIAEKRRQMKPMFLLAIACLAVTQLSLCVDHRSLAGMSVSLFLFFTAFTFLEASLPSLISKLAPAGTRGTAMGIYSACQFFGIFLGGLAGGALYGHFGIATVFFVGSLIAAIWFMIAAYMQKPRHLTTQLVQVGNMSETHAANLCAEACTIDGVVEAFIVAKEGVAYLKIDNAIVNQNALLQLFASPPSTNK